MDDIRGKIWKFGDHVDTDAIVSGRYLDAPIEEAAAHVLENIRPEFPERVRAGDIIVAGKNFGCGSSREQAVSVLKQIGLSCVVAESFGRIFFRNAIAVGLPVATCPGAALLFEDQDLAEISINNRVVKNITKNTELPAEALSREIMSILDLGGILAYLKQSTG